MTNYKSVLERVKEKNKDVTLVAVSKTKSVSDILDSYNQGARIFGENRVQEILEKFPLPLEKKDYSVYLIGHLQSNKVKKAVSAVDRIESVDSIELLEKINKECAAINKKMDILFEVNSSMEENKSGFRDKLELFKAVERAKELKNINLIGLMTVGPLGNDREKNIKAFNYTKLLFTQIKEIHPISVLSMGMSSDWIEAIDSGSTEVRIGSTIFGKRE